MIKDRNIADDAMIAGHKVNHVKNVGAESFYVGTAGTAAYNLAKLRVPAGRLFTTINAALDSCVANRGDIIYILPVHAETVATASGITLDIAGVSVYCLGEGADRPTLTFSATDATMVISAASVAMLNFIVKPSIDSVVSPIVVSGTDCVLDYEHQDASATVEAVNSLLTTATADRLAVNLKYRGFIAGNACVNAIRLVGVDTARIFVDFYGVASTSVVEFHTTECYDIEVDGLFHNSGTTDLTKNVVDTVTGSTWYVSADDSAAGSHFSGGSASAIAADDLSAISTNVDAILVDTGTTLPATLAAVIDMQEKSVSGSTAVMVNADNVFTIAGGPIEILELISECIALNDATASTLQYSANPTVGAATTFSGASGSLANAAAGSGVVLNQTALATAPDIVDPLVALSGVNARGIIVAAGVITLVVGVGSTTGTWKHYLRYRPLASGVTVTAD